MSNTCETVKVKSPVSDDNPLGFIVINQADFDKDKHELFVEDIPSGANSGMTVPQIKEALTAKGIDIPSGANKAELLALLTPSE